MFLWRNLTCEYILSKLLQEMIQVQAKNSREQSAVLGMHGVWKGFEKT